MLLARLSPPLQGEGWVGMVLQTAKAPKRNAVRRKQRSPMNTYFGSVSANRVKRDGG